MNLEWPQGSFLFDPFYFQPTYQKGKDQVCGGVQVHVTDRNKYNSFLAGIRLLGAIFEDYPKQFAWKQPPYEYENEKMPIDLIAGTAGLREALLNAGKLKNFEERAAHELNLFRKIRKQYLLYPTPSR